MSTKYITREGDTVDFVAFKYYGTLDGNVTEKVLDANPGLAARGAALPDGVEIVLPVIEQPTTTRGVKLWD